MNFLRKDAGQIIHQARHVSQPDYLSDTIEVKLKYQA